MQPSSLRSALAAFGALLNDFGRGPNGSKDSVFDRVADPDPAQDLAAAERSGCGFGKTSQVN